VPPLIRTQEVVGGDGGTPACVAEPHVKITVTAPTTADAALGPDLKSRRTATLRARLPVPFLAGPSPARKARLTGRQLGELEADWRAGTSCVRQVPPDAPNTVGPHAM
jgi:hypothetical protein